MAGYTRQDTANNIANGNVIDADDFDAEYNAIESAFNASTGHSHDGTAGEGAPITKVGPSQDLVVSAMQVLPKTTNTLDLGSSEIQFKNAFFDGTVDADAFTGPITGNVTGNVTGNLTGNVTGNLTGNVTGNLAGNVTGTVSDISNHTTDVLTEGTANLYYTDGRVRNAVSATGSINYNSSTGVFSFTQGNTDTVNEGTSNLYFTTERARGSVSATGSLSYDSSTGVFSFTQGNTDTVAEGTSNLYYTDTRVQTYISGNRNYGDITSTGNVIVQGNLTVSGTTTTVNTETINLADNVITLNSNETGTPSQNGGIEIERGTAVNKTFIWDEAADKWTVGSETFVAGTFEGNIATSSDFSIDSGGDITLDADGEQIYFKDGGDTRLTFNLDATPSIAATGALEISSTNSITATTTSNVLVTASGLSSSVAFYSGSGYTKFGTPGLETFRIEQGRSYSSPVKFYATHPVTGNLEEQIRIDSVGVNIIEGLRVGDVGSPTDNDIYAVGNIEAGYNITAGGDLEVGFDIIANGNITCNKIDFGDWTITESGTTLYFAVNGVNKMQLDASGNLTVTGNVTAYGTV